MNPKTKLILALTMMTLVTLACATLTGNSPQEQPAEPVALPTNTPLPPLPTSTPKPPAPEPTEEPAAAPTEEPAVQPAGDMLFFDDFSDPNSGWDRYSDAEGSTDYENGAYKIAVYTDTYFYWANPYRNFGDQIIEVEASQTSADTDTQYGIVCRHQDVENWYALVISADGFAAIRERYQGGELEYIADWVQVSAINQGQATNMLRAECVGTHLSLYVNGVLAIDVFNADIPAGDAGLIAGTFDTTLVEALFDNFKVSAP
ncbi:MAG: hypothetical protein ACK2T7_08800 [Anaerolineales bacterium]